MSKVVKPASTYGSMARAERSRSSCRPSRSMSATCQSPVTTREMSRSGARRRRSGRRMLAMKVLSYSGGRVAKSACVSTPRCSRRAHLAPEHRGAHRHHPEPDHGASQVPGEDGVSEVPGGVHHQQRAEEHESGDGHGAPGGRGAQDADLPRERRVAARERENRAAHQEEVDQHRGDQDVHAEEEVARQLTAEDSQRGHRRGDEDRHPRRVEARVHRGDDPRDDAVLGPGEHQPRDTEEHRREVLHQGDRCPGHHGDPERRREAGAEKGGGGGVVPQRLVANHRPRDRVVHGAGEQRVEDGHDADRQADREGERPGGIARLAARLGDGVEPDEAGEQERGRSGHGAGPGNRGRRPARGTTLRPEDEPGDDHHRSEQEGEAEERQEHALVGLEPPEVHPHEGPQDRERKQDPDRREVEPARRCRRAGGHRDVPDEGRQQIAHHADGEAQREPLREAGDEAQVRAQAPARVDVASAGPWHRRGEDGVGEPGQDRGHGGEQVGEEDPGPDAGDVALDHERHHVDAGAHHRGDPGRGEADQTDAPHQSRACQGRGGT